MMVMPVRVIAMALWLSWAPPVTQAGDAIPGAAQVYTRVRATVALQLGVDLKSIVADQPLVELGMDELDLVELIMALEEDFGIQIPDEAIESNGAKGWHDAVTTQRFAAIVQEQLSKKK